MKPIRRVFVVGGAVTPFIGKKHPDFVWKGHPDFGKRDNPTLEEHLGAAVRGCLAQCGADAAVVDKGYVGNFAGELFSSQGHLGAMMPRVEPGFDGKPFTRVEAACASGGLAVIGAIEAIQAGRDVVITAGAETQTTVSAREGADYLARASHYPTERGLDDFTFPAMFARRAKAYKERYGVTDEDIAHVVVKAYANANLNPLAHMRAVQVDLATAAAPSDANPLFLKNEALNAHLKMLDCSQVSDGAAAALLASEEGLAKLGLRPADCVEVTGYGQSTAALGQVTDYTAMTNTRRAIEEAYASAGITERDVEVVELHDCFSITEVLMIEALGLAEPGRGADLAKGGRSHIGGAVPINTGGGLIAFGHPVGATGIKQVIEVCRQIRGECGAYQIPETPRVGVAANMGGDDRSAAVFVLRG